MTKIVDFQAKREARLKQREENLRATKSSAPKAAEKKQTKQNKSKKGAKIEL